MKKNVRPKMASWRNLLYSRKLGPPCISAELFPLDVRSFMAGFANMVGSVYIFLVVKTYPAMAASITAAGAYWFYASIRCAMLLSSDTKPLK